MGIKVKARQTKLTVAPQKGSIASSCRQKSTAR